MKVTEMKHQAKAQEWRENIADCRSSGGTVRNWCHEHGFSVSTYYRWERELFGKLDIGQRRAIEPVVQQEIVELSPPVPVLASDSVQQKPEPRAVAKLRIGMAEVDFYEGANPEMITVLCQVLRHAE